MQHIQKKFNFDLKVSSVTKDASGECIVEGYANTSSKDRVGDVVYPKAFEKTLPIYLKNPILLVNHNWSDVCGKVLEARIVDKGLFVKARISDTRPDIKTLVKEGCLSTFSIGYNEIDSDYDESTKTKYVNELELLEISIVSVPANHEASFQISENKEENAQEPEAKQEVKVSRQEGESESDCVARAIPVLISEGYEQEQAVAIAYSMCSEKGICSVETKAAIKNLHEFIQVTKEVTEDKLNNETVLALCKYYNTNGVTMTKEELIKVLKVKSVEQAVDAKKEEQPAEAPPAPADEKPEEDAMAKVMAKLDAIAEAMAQLLEASNKTQATEEAKPEGEKAQETCPACGQPMEDGADGKKECKKCKEEKSTELSPEDIEKALKELDDQILSIEETENL